MQPCEYVGQFTRCAVWAAWGIGPYRAEREVTSESQWISSAPEVAGVVGPGTIRSVAPGSVEITVQFSGRQLMERFRVLAEGPPWRIYRGDYHIDVLDANGARMEGVLVEIIAGPNAGMSAVSDRFGTAIFSGDHVCGPIAVRATKAGYREWIGSATRCGNGGNGSWGSETVGPVRMIPMA